MNAPENINIINAAHGVLQRAKDALSVAEVALAIGASKSVASKQLKELYRQGLIESEPRAGGTSFYRLIVASESLPTKTYPPETLRAMIADLEAEKAGEPSFLAPEDYQMPPADPALLAMANRTLSEQLDEYRGQLAHIATTAADYLPDPSDITTARAVEIMDMLIDAQRGQIESLSAELPAKDYELVMQARRAIELGVKIDEQDKSIDSLTKDVINTRAALNKAINEADRLRRELTDAQEVTDAAVGYLVRVTKRKPRYIVKPERAREAALAAVRAGAGRADLLAVVPVGVARRGAEWQGINPRPNEACNG